MPQTPPPTSAFISDLHLSAKHPQTFAWFAAFLQNATAQLERLYLLGDLFDYWVGDDGVDTLGHARARDALRDVADAGVRVYFMHGNRDFLLGEQFARDAGIELLPDPSVIELYGRKFLLSHGDSLCTDDLEHQEARRTMLTAKWRTAFLQQPLDARIQTAAEMRSASERNKQHKSMKLMDVNQQAVESLMRAHNVNTLIHGHTHRPAVHQFELNGQPAWRYVLGDWHRRVSALYYRRGYLALKR